MLGNDRSFIRGRQSSNKLDRKIAEEGIKSETGLKKGTGA